MLLRRTINQSRLHSSASYFSLSTPLRSSRPGFKPSNCAPRAALVSHLALVANYVMRDCIVAGLIKLRELVRSPHNGDLEIHLRQADPESYRAVLKEIKSKEIHNIVIDTKPSNMQHFLKGVRSCVTRFSNGSFFDIL